jgi:UDP-2-acetamido-3-amino-2,3-dideoxy-glucuronate N-acetyltransferase
MCVDQLLEVARCRLCRFPTIVDGRGRLTVAEFAAMPFTARRAFFISEVPPGETRGGHAQRTCVELLLPIKGSVVVAVDDGTRTQDILLQDPTVGLVIAPRVWCVLSRFSEGTVLAVFARPTRFATMQNSWRSLPPVDARHLR